MPRTALAMLLALLWVSTSFAEEPTTTDAPNEEAERGHSQHGDFYNEGPRQHAYLMGGTGHVNFPVTSEHEQVQAFVEQGIGQVYGFWYLEAERSFRHAASLDPDCAIAYWGAALATLSDAQRSRGFMAEAVERKDNASERERMYIDSLDTYLKADKAKGDERDKAYRKALEAIVLKYPDDLDAKALLAYQLYKNRESGRYLATDAFIGRILKEQPQHSVHHFRIHLWDSSKPEKALESAANCGQGSPSIAHMWHMPGHIYSKLKRYEDACFQQEASARVDHYHMMHDRLLPDQIFNYAHNNEWLIRNLNYVGRVRDAVDLAKNMVELPRHPKYNTLKRGSSQYGRRRLIETLEQYELWEEAIALCNSSYLEPTADEGEQIKRLRLLGTAQASLGETGAAEQQLQTLQDRKAEATKKRDSAQQEAETKQVDELLKKQEKQLAEAKAAAEKVIREEVADDEAKTDEQLPGKIDQAVADATAKFREELIKREKKAIDKAKSDAARSHNRTISEIDKAISAIEGYIALATDDYKAALPLLKKAGGVDAMLLAKVQYQADEKRDEALKTARQHVERNKNEVQPQAAFVDLLWLAGEKEEARKALEQLQKISSSIDMQSPVFQRVTPIAEELGFAAEWTLPYEQPTDVGSRPPLDSLGPFRWRPSPAPAWTLPNATGESVALKQFSGKPVVVIFYLGFGCLHCAEQLHKFAPEVEAFRKAGIEIVAISSDDVEGLKKSIDDYTKEPLPIPLVSNSKLDVFRQYRVFDDFEQQPLHGTFVIDGQGDVLWQDISYEPFMDPGFVLEEAQRLLGQRNMNSSPVANAK